MIVDDKTTMDQDKNKQNTMKTRLSPPYLSRDTQKGEKDKRQEKVNERSYTEVNKMK